MISASSRCGRNRQRSWFSGSLLEIPAVIEADDHLIGLRGHHQPVQLLDAPAAFMNSTAIQSSSSGCVGSSPILPKLSSVATMPRPKW